MNAPHPQWLVPDWPAAPRVKALVTTRAGGNSSGPYAGMNLGRRTADDPAAVEANHAQLNRLLPAPPRWLQQIHGSTVVDADTLTGLPGDIPQADASVARRPGTVCAILVADCLPVLLTDRAGSCIAAAHAGWRGLAGGVLANTIARMPVQPADLMAWIGPGIGPTAFEVGDDVLHSFCADAPERKSAFRALRPGKWLCDLPALARDVLRCAGVTEVYGGGFCTYTDEKRFYSHRRNPVTGRMAALLWLEGATADTV